MSSRYDHHQSFPLQKPIFLPIICRLSIKDVEPNHHHRRRRIPSLDVPSSPRVSCIGQVKRDNRITAVAAPPPPPPTANHHKHKSRKPRSLLLQTTNGGAGGGVSGSCRTSREEITLADYNSRRLKSAHGTDHRDHRRDCAKVVVDIGELDPPLPVVKMVAPPRDEVNLWRRRCLRGAAELKSLQIKQEHLPNIINSEPPPTV